MIDITIRGAGIMGLTLAWHCLNLGASVKVIDPNGIANGASGGIVGALAPHVPENWNIKKQFQLESLLYSQKFWRDVDNISGLNSGYKRTGRLQPLMDEPSVTLAKKRKETAKDLWQNFATWEIIDNSKEWELMSPTGFWIFDNLSALIHPRLACLSLAQALNKKGCEFLLEGKNQGKVIWATGVHDLSRISQKFEKNFGNGVKGQAALFKLKKPRSAQLFAETLHFIPHLDGTLAVGSTSENSFEHGDTNDGNLQALIIKASNILPELKGKDPICTWADVRPRSRSRAPVLGEHPIYPSEFIMNGGFKIGLGMAPQMGKVFSEFLLQNVNNIPTEFLPSVSL